MKRTIFMLVVVFLLSTVLVSGEAFSLDLTSSKFEDGERIPDIYTCKGKDVSPPLEWKRVPKGTKSFVLVMDDPDAPLGTWIHWVVYNIPADYRYLTEDMPREMITDDGIIQGMNSFRLVGYGGPCPPPGSSHRYIFKLYALDTELQVLPGSPKGTVVKAMQGHILAEAKLTGIFSR